MEKSKFRSAVGYIAEDWKLLAKNYDYPTKDTNCVYIFWTKNIVKEAEQKLDNTEVNETEIIPCGFHVQKE